MEYSKLVDLYENLEKTTKKLEKTKLIADFILQAENPKIVIPLIQGKIFHESENKDIGVADKLMISALEKLGINKKIIIEKLKQTGDLGLVVEELIKTKKQVSLFGKILTVEKVYNSIREIAYIEGKKSQEKKLNIIIELLNSAKPKEAKYIVRTVLEDLRLGVADGIIRDAISSAYNVNKESVEYAYNLKTDFGEVAEIAKNDGEEGLKKVKIELGKPIKVMLAEKAEDIESALNDSVEPAIEIKYDGMRTLIEKKYDKIWLFTRRLENVTKQFPDLVELCRKNIKADMAVIEGETIGIDRSTQRPIPFQELSKRIHRKYEIEDMCKKIPIQIKIFDCLLTDNEQILDKPFKERRKMLEKIVNIEEGRFQLAEQIKTKEVNKVKEFYKKSIKDGHEGVMVKNLLAEYKPGKRVGYMYKVKPEKESLDLVITGGEWGQGRRAKWLASFILSARDEETGELLEIGKMGTGLTDEQFKKITEILKPYIICEKDNIVKVKPKIVVEVGYQELQKSPNYSSGYALRFPKLIRFREDKSIEEADTIQRIRRLYEKYK